MGSNDVQTIPIGINVRSAVRCAKAVHQPWKAHDTSLPDTKSIVGLNRENTNLEKWNIQSDPTWASRCGSGLSRQRLGVCLRLFRCLCAILFSN